MVGSWYRIYASKNVSWIFMLPFFLFCRGKCKGHAWANMKTKSMQFVDQKLCWMRMHDDAMTHVYIMKRCLCDAWYECIYGHESPENYLFLLAHLGAQCPMCIVKKVIWTFRLPVTKEETNIQCVLEIKYGSDLIRTDFWSKNMGWTHFIQKVYN